MYPQDSEVFKEIIDDGRWTIDLPESTGSIWMRYITLAKKSSGKSAQCSFQVPMKFLKNSDQRKSFKISIVNGKLKRKSKVDHVFLKYLEVSKSDEN